MACQKTVAWTATLGALVLFASAALAQPAGGIVYNKVNPQGFLETWQIYADGSADLHLPVDAGYPVWSPNGLEIGLSTPARPFVFSWNVFIFNTLDGTLQQLTSFEDIADPQGSFYFLALWKAFAPDAQRVAVGFYSVFVSPTGGSSVPILEIYGRDGSMLARVVIANDASQHQGDGVDWSPVADLLVYPLLAPGLIPPTALYLTLPVQDGLLGQLTFPASWQDAAGLHWEQDFQPAFSPDGQQVAYIRSTSDVLFCCGFLFSTPSIRIVNIDGTNDREVARFLRRNYVGRVSWSPDATQLVFDGGQEAASSEGFPLGIADPQTMALYTINVEGTGFGQLQVAPSLYPSWNPLGLGAAAVLDAAAQQ